MARSDEAAFTALFDRHARAVYAYCFRRTADWTLAEDLTSIVFLEAWRRRRDADLPWLLGTATNVIRNHRRSLRRYGAALERLRRSRPAYVDVAERIDDGRRMREILAAVEQLPEPEQDAFALCVWQGLSGAEAAQALGIPEPTIRTRLSRARARLRRLVAEVPPEVGVL